MTAVDAATEARRRYSRDRQRAIRAGEWEYLHDVAEVRAHIDGLRAAGMSVRAIAAAAGLSIGTVSPITWADHVKNVRGVTVPVARALLAVTGPEQSPPQSLVPAVGSVRRLRALARMGWTVRDVAADCGIAHQTLSGLTEDGRTTMARATALAATYDRLSMRVGPSTRTRAWATNRGYAPPLAWDDSTIDDPTARPEGAGYRPAPVIESIRELEAQGLTRDAIAGRLGITRDAVDHAISRAERRAAA